MPQFSDFMTLQCPVTITPFSTSALKGRHCFTSHVSASGVLTFKRFVREVIALLRLNFLVSFMLYILLSSSGNEYFHRAKYCGFKIHTWNRQSEGWLLISYKLMNTLKYSATDGCQPVSSLFRCEYIMRLKVHIVWER